jgi:hypothetical protein
MEFDSPAPSVVPTSRGGVQLEWHTPLGELEISVNAAGSVSGFFEDVAGDEWEFEQEEPDLNRLASILGRLATRD